MDNNFEITVTALLGLESFCSRELKRMGCENIRTQDGRVTFTGGMDDVAKVNMRLRTGERVFINMGEFEARTFDELFEGTRAIEWERFIGKSSCFPVKGSTLRSKLASERDCQKIIKKAVSSRLSSKYGIEWLPETGEKYQIQFLIIKDHVTLMIDTSGDPLHKRGYRPVSNLAPLRETLAAAMVMLSYWKYEYPLCDPFCGSGTIPIEAAMFKRNMAPGINRRFAYEDFAGVDKAVRATAQEEARDLVRATPLEIIASDIDADTVEIARTNIKNAGLQDVIKPFAADARGFKSGIPYGTIICNPPYGERLGDKAECEKLYGEIGKMYSRLNKWSCYVLAADEDFERHFGKPCSKRRKVYNGMIKCNIYQYFGARPPKSDKRM